MKAGARRLRWPAASGARGLRRLARAVLPGILGFLLGCAGSIARISPERSGAEARHSYPGVPRLIHPSAPTELTSSSGVIVSERRLLLARHFWEGCTEDGADAGLASVLEFYVVTGDLINLPEGWDGGPLPIRQDGTKFESPWMKRVELHLVAAGEGPDQDWVLAEASEPCWGPERITPLHQPALEPGWSPVGEVLWMVGHSSIFEDPEQPVVLNALQGPYAVSGAGTADEELSMEYPHSWPPPGGASGGGFFVWNELTNRAELVGLFCTWARSPHRAWLHGPALRSLPVDSFAGGEQSEAASLPADRRRWSSARPDRFLLVPMLFDHDRRGTEVARVRATGGVTRSERGDTPDRSLLDGTTSDEEPHSPGRHARRRPADRY